jgi:hypothetical protein
MEASKFSRFEINVENTLISIENICLWVKRLTWFNEDPNLKLNAKST